VSEKHKVYIIESESGWGTRVDETIPFDTYEKARKYCVDYNQKHNMEDEIPSWYMYACLANPREGDDGLLRE
jgi:nitrous oxide reductase accessory protein NosL